MTERAAPQSELEGRSVHVLSEDTPRRPRSASQRDIRRATEAARIAGATLHAIPQHLDGGVSAEDALVHLPLVEPGSLTFWIGGIPPLSHYRAIHAAAGQRGYALVNDPSAHARATYLQRSYEALRGLTPRSRFVDNVHRCADVAETLAFPLFVKGAVRSRKHAGPSACVATDPSSLEQLVAGFLDAEADRGGVVAIREYVALRHSRTSRQGFPFGREYRVFVYRGAVIGVGYYWDGDDPLAELRPEEAASVETLALRAARRIATPFAAIDIAQTVEGDWIVIETGDGQFAGLSQVDPLKLWHNLVRVSLGEGEGGQESTPASSTGGRGVEDRL